MEAFSLAVEGVPVVGADLERQVVEELEEGVAESDVRRHTEVNRLQVVQTLSKNLFWYFDQNKVLYDSQNCQFGHR